MARQAQRMHVNTLLVNNRRLKKRQRRRLATLAKTYGFNRIMLPHAATRSVRRGESRCAKLKRKHPTSLCTLVAKSLTRARRLSSSPSVDRVVVRLKRLPPLKSLQMSGSTHGSVVVLVEIGRKRAFAKSAWRSAIRQALSDPNLDLAVLPVGRYRTRALSEYFGLLTGGSPPPPPPPAPPPPGKANLWVDTTAGSCVRSATPAAYNDAQACSWSAANNKCAGRDDVVVRGGNYGNLRIRGSGGRSSACIFWAASGQSVVANDLNLGEWQSCHPGANGTTTSWLTLVGPIKTREFHADCSNRVTVDGLDMDAGGAQITQPFHVEDATYFTLRNSKVHNALNSNAMMVLDGSNFVFDRNDIYDDLNNTDGAIHDECFRAQPVTNMTMTRNHFWSCAVMDVFLTGTETATNWLVENNVFEAPLGSSGNAANAFAFRSGGSPSPSPDGFVLRYNTFGSSGVQANQGDNPPTAAGFTVVGNYFDTNAPCGLSNTTYAYNITPSGENNCGGTGSQSLSASALRAGFVKYQPYTGDQGGSAQAPGNYQLLNGSPLVNRGTTGNYPSLDFTGLARYRGLAPDVGAYERP